MPAANTVKLKVADAGGAADGAVREGGGWTGTETGIVTKKLVAQADLEPSEVQDLGDLVPQLLEIKNKANTPVAFRVRIEVGDGQSDPDAESADAISKLLQGIREDFKLQ
jgi:hypothetical protein